MRERSAPSAWVAASIDEECFCSPLRVLHRAVSGIYEDAFRPYGVTAAQFTLLVNVARLGAEASAPALARALYLDRSTLSRDLSRMESNGWLARNYGKDKRSPKLRLSPTGAALLSLLERAWAEAQADAEEILGASLASQLKHSARGLLRRDLPATEAEPSE
jgi:DNA-binding MarR family transcriptional regulator